MFGANYFGQTYFADGYASPETGPCGSMHFGAPYFGQMPRCGAFFPPQPPATNTARIMFAGDPDAEYIKRRQIINNDILDVVQVLTLWLNRN